MLIKHNYTSSDIPQGVVASKFSVCASWSVFQESIKLASNFTKKSYIDWFRLTAQRSKTLNHNIIVQDQDDLTPTLLAIRNNRSIAEPQQYCKSSLPLAPATQTPSLPPDP
jgi:hypothetical protein